MRKAMIVTLAGLLVAACGQVPQAGPRSGDDVLFVVRGSAVIAVDATNRTALAQLPPGVPSADWKHYYATAGTRLEDLDPITGVAQRSLEVPAQYQLPVVTAAGELGGLSQNGRWLVLDGRQAGGESHFSVFETSFTTPSRSIDIAGDFTFDTISNDGARVFLIQHAQDGHYFVRDYVLGVGLDPNIIFDKTDGGAAMSGVRLMGVPSFDGSWLYSVYARPATSAFVHELNLDATVAVCVDLAGPGYAADDKAMRWSLAMSKSGQLFAVNGPLGIAMVVEGGLTARIAAMGAVTATLVTPDGRSVLIAGAGVRRLDASSLRVVSTALESWTLVGLTQSADGKAVYAVSASGQVARLDSAGNVTATFDTGLGYIDGVRGSATFS